MMTIENYQKLYDHLIEDRDYYVDSVQGDGDSGKKCSGPNTMYEVI